MTDLNPPECLPQQDDWRKEELQAIEENAHLAPRSMQAVNFANPYIRISFPLPNKNIGQLVASGSCTHGMYCFNPITVYAACARSRTRTVVNDRMDTTAQAIEGLLRSQTYAS
jgi:hypothetical protein